MRIRVLLFTSLLLAPASFAPLARAQGPAGAERAGPSPAGADADAPATPDAEASRAPARARPGIEEIVIQAGESQAAADFEAADSVAAFDASDLEALGAQSVEDLAAFTPNLEIVTSGATTPTFFIRGVGLNDFNPNSAGAVGVYQDDVPLNSPALQLGTLFDIEAVNILRGPQGTGPFRNASAGAIKIYSRKPTGEYGANLTSTYGNYDYLDFQGAVEAPVYEDILAARFAFRYSQRDGYLENGCGDAPSLEERGIRPPGGNFDAYEGFELVVEAEKGTSPTDPRWSNCGEYVPPTSVRYDPAYPFPYAFQVENLGISGVPPGLPTQMNALQNWAARGTLRFQPTLDMEWLLTAHGARRDELSRLGQSYGTRMTVYDQACLEEEAEKGTDITRPSRIEHCRVIGVLGGFDNAAYRAPEVLERVNELNPCRGPDGTLTGECDAIEAALADNAALHAMAEELAADLDSEPHRGDFNRAGPTTNDVWGVSLKSDIALGESVFLSTVSGYETYDRVVDIDLDFSPNQLFEIRTEDDGWQMSQDLELSGYFSEELPLRWTLGGFYLMEELNVVVANSFLPVTAAVSVSDRDYTQSLWSAAGYAGFEWDFWDDFTLDGGVRYNWERKEIDYSLEKAQIGLTLEEFHERIWQAPTGTIRLTYRFREDTHAYWKYTRGWKGGHFNATSSAREGVTAAEPEEIDAFEAGLRGSWFGGRLGTDFSVFHYNYANYQIFTAQQQLGAQPEFVVLNANNAEVYGAELDLVARPLPGLYLQARLSWLESHFLDFVQIQQASEQKGNRSVPVDIEIQNTGNPLLNSPRWKVSLTAEQMVPLGRFGTLSARWDGAWTDDTNYDATDSLGVPNSQGIQFLPENTIGQRAFWLHNVRLAYTTPGGGVEVAAWVRNLEDKAYKTFAFDGSTFNDTTIYFVGEPRTYGLTVTTTF